MPRSRVPDAEHLVAGLPNAEPLVLVDGGTHATNLTHPAEVNAAIKELPRRPAVSSLLDKATTTLGFILHLCLAPIFLTMGLVVPAWFVVVLIALVVHDDGRRHRRGASTSATWWWRRSWRCSC